MAPLLCCGIAITLTGEIWKRASLLPLHFFSHSESTMCSSINYSVGGGRSTTCANSSLSVGSTTSETAKFSEQNFHHFLMSELASALVLGVTAMLAPFFLSVGGSWENFADAVTAVPCTLVHRWLS